MKPLEVADLATNSMLILLGTCFSAGQTLPLGKWLFLVWLFKLFVGAFVTSLDWAFFDSGAVLQYCILDGALRLCPPFHHSEDYARRRRSFWFKNCKNRESSSACDVSDVYKIGRWLRDLRRPSGGGSDGHIYQTSMKILGPVKRSVLISLQSTHSQERFNEFRKTTELKMCLKGEMLWKRQKLPRAK